MTHRPAPLPPKLEAWLAEHPPDERAALEQAWAAVSVMRAPAPDPECIEALWAGLATATAVPNLPADVRTALNALPDEDQASLAEAWQMASLLQPPTADPNPARIDAMWAALDPSPPAAPPDAVSHRARASARRSSHRQDRAPRAASRTRLRWATGLVALLVIVAVSVTLWLRPTTLQAPLGEVLTATLPDGSTVTLNSGTELVYDRHFGRTHRTLILRGEAFFEVTESEDPFSVETFNAVATVLGTEFNVRAWPEGGTRETMVSVLSGRVQVSARMADTARVDLTAGQIGWVQQETTPMLFTNASVADQLAWRSGDFIFRNATLAQMFDEIERRFDVRINAPPPLRERRWVYVERDVTNADSLLQNICEALGLEYRVTTNGYEVYQP